MARKSEYVIAVAMTNGKRHRVWNPRKADAVAFGKAMWQAAIMGEERIVDAIAVFGGDGYNDKVAWESRKDAYLDLI